MSRVEVHSSQVLPEAERKVITDISLALISMHKTGMSEPANLLRPAEVGRQLIRVLAERQPDSVNQDVYENLILAIAALMLGDGAAVIQPPIPPGQIH